MAAYLAGWVAGYLARHPFVIWQADWKMFFILSGWLGVWLAGGLIGGVGQADYLGGAGDLGIWLATYMVTCLAGKLSGWQSDWMKGYLPI